MDFKIKNIGSVFEEEDQKKYKLSLHIYVFNSIESKVKN